MGQIWSSLQLTLWWCGIRKRNRIRERRETGVLLKNSRFTFYHLVVC